ncbi:PERF protein, partial [Turnix velox]|nr:PERF protein [Turnix velox]
CCSPHRGTARVGVRVMSGRGWHGDVVTSTDAYVAAILEGRKTRTPTVWNQNQPRWDAILDLGVTTLTPGAILRLEVWDEDEGWNDDLLGGCEVALTATGGHLKREVCFPGGGRLEFGYEVTCGPALGGDLCQDYVPQAPRCHGGGDPDSHWVKV